MSALHIVADRMKIVLDRWEIKVPRNEQAIYWNGERILVSRESSRRECEAVLKRVIKKANYKFEEENQRKLV